MAKDAAKATKTDAPAKPKGEKKPSDAKPKADKAEKAAAAPAPQEEKKPVEPRKPADPRLKLLKKFYGTFLPKGPLRERHKTIMTRWDSGEDHGGVTVEELRSLLDDWRAVRAKRRAARRTET